MFCSKFSDRDADRAARYFPTDAILAVDEMVFLNNHSLHRCHHISILAKSPCVKMLSSNLYVRWRALRQRFVEKFMKMRNLISWYRARVWPHETSSQGRFRYCQIVRCHVQVPSLSDKTGILRRQKPPARSDRKGAVANNVLGCPVSIIKSTYKA